MQQSLEKKKEMVSMGIRILTIVTLVELATKTIEPVFISAFPAMEDAIIHSFIVVLMTASLLAWLVVFPLVQERKNELVASQNLALHDPLTGLPNRLLLSEYLDRCIAGNPRYHFTGALLYFDLDGFKKVNDRHGHEAGDVVLTTLGRRLKNTLRAEDFVSRVGGDEFVLLVQSMGLDLPRAKQEAFQIAQKVQALIGNPIEIMGQRFHIGCSVGICMLSCKRLSPALALRQADLAMYKAKENTPHQIVFADELELRSYSISSTCISEIDQEHIEIDALLEEAIAAKGDHGTYSRRITHAIHRHFKNEEHISRKKSLNMTDEHIETHRKLNEKVSALCKPTRNNNTSEVYQSIQELLREHVVTFDRELCALSNKTMNHSERDSVELKK